MHAGAIIEGRLTIGITKFDATYGSSSSSRKGTVTEKMLRKRVIHSIQNAVGVTVSEAIVIPLCGEWALTGSKLANCLHSEIHVEEKKIRLEEAVSTLQKYPHLSLPGGQGQSQREMIMGLQPNEIVRNVEKASGISRLKKRYACCIGKFNFFSRITFIIWQDHYGGRRLLMHLSYSKHYTRSES